MISRNRRRYGGYAVHLGIVVLFIGLAASKGFATEGDIALRQGDRAQLAGYTFVHEGSTRNADAHKMSVSVRLGVLDGGERVATLRPGVDRFRADGTRASDVAIDSSPGRDLYVVLNTLSEDGAATLTVFVNPLVLWLWIAGVLMGLGGLLAAWPGPPASRREPARSPTASGEARV
jgi:cytochrome c-type biogenesis protein CcmF